MLFCLFLQGLFKSNYFFFFVVLLHILALDIGSYLVLLYLGSGWIPWIISVLMFATAQVCCCYVKTIFLPFSLTMYFQLCNTI